MVRRRVSAVSNHEARLWNMGRPVKPDDDDR
jgi:hypothetical protein